MSETRYAIGPAIGQQIVGEVSNPFQRKQANHLSAGTVAIESERAIAEAQGKMVIAKRFPRDEAVAFARVMESARRPTLAKVANYAFPRGGQTVSGPSIRLAEELARCWGNIDYGIRELSRRDGESEMEAYAWDLETNTMSSQKFTARHIRDKKGGGEALREERDIYELTANLGARRLRARILAILPPDLVDAAVSECRKTLAGDNSAPLADQVRTMTQAFARIGVNADMLVTKLGHHLDDVTPDELADLREIFSSIKDGVAKTSEFFGHRDHQMSEKPANKLDALEKIAQSEKVEAEPTADPDTDFAADLVGQMRAAKTLAALKAVSTKDVRAKVAEIGKRNPDLYAQIVQAGEDRAREIEHPASPAADDGWPGDTGEMEV